MKISRFGVTVAGTFALSLAAAPAYAQGGPFSYFAVTPCRVVDTRNAPSVNGGPAIVGKAPARAFQIQGLCGIPVGAKAVSLNVTITAPMTWGNLRIFPSNLPVPLVSTINFMPGDQIANGAIVPLAAATNDLSVYFDAGQAGQTIHVIMDVTGYFQ